MSEPERRHYTAGFRNVSAGKLWWQGLCGCSAVFDGSDRHYVEAELTGHIIRSNAADKLKEKEKEMGKPMITHHDITRRIYELEIPASGTLAELERAIDTLKLHAEKSEEIVAGDATYTVRDGRDPGDRVIVLSYSVNLG